MYSVNSTLILALWNLRCPSRYFFKEPLKKVAVYRFDDVRILHKPFSPSVLHISYKSVNPLFKLWHKKLGHPSHKVIPTVSLLYSVMAVRVLACVTSL